MNIRIPDIENTSNENLNNIQNILFEIIENIYIYIYINGEVNVY